MSDFSIHSIVLKVAAPCNLNCTYCYEYNRGDSSWRSKPKHIPSEIVERLGARIAEYVSLRGLGAFQVNLHGGEPTLLGAAGLERVITALSAAAPGVLFRFGMQTNATLVTPEIVEVLARHDVRVGVSLDGDMRANRLRVDHQGRGSWERTVSGLRLLTEARLVSGVQAVIDLDSDPEVVLDALGEFQPPLIELSQPFGNHDNPPRDSESRHSLGSWLSRAFDHWERTPALRGMRVGILADALRAIMTERPASEWFPGVPQGFIVVATDGSYEGLDTLKIVGDEGRVLGMTVHSHSIQDALDHHFIQLRAGSGGLCAECTACPISRWCAGGYFPTRYGRGRGFDNPSVYCTDLKALFGHLGGWLAGQEAIDSASRERILCRLQALTVGQSEVHA